MKNPTIWLTILTLSPPLVAVLFAPSAIAAAPSASASVRASSSSKPFDVGVEPDPAPLVTRKKWVYEVFYHEGAVFTPTPVLRDAGKPTETPRRMGRFAIELYNGPDLVERIRFELPMLNGDPFTGKERPHDAPPDMERRVRVKMKIEVPATDRANRAYFVDRATKRKIRLPWSLQQPTNLRL